MACAQALKAEGKAYPRTCSDCGLGPCKYSLAPPRPQLRYVQAQGHTWEEILQNMRSSPLYAIGDCTLVWVNEGDFWALMPTDVAAEDKDRREYERLKAKFEPSRVGEGSNR